MRWHPSIEPNRLYIQLSRITIEYVVHWQTHHTYKHSCKNDNCHKKLASSLLNVLSPFVKNKDLHAQIYNSWSLALKDEKDVGILIQKHPYIALVFKYKSSAQ